MSAMAPTGPSLARHVPRIGVAALLTCALLAHASWAYAAEPFAWCSLGILGGTTMMDPDLAHYQWDIRPSGAWGVVALAGRGPFAIGVRGSRSNTTQRLTLAGVTTPSPSVVLTTLDVTTRVKLASVLGLAVSGALSAGQLRTVYRPSHLSIPVAGGPDLETTFSPIHTWVGGAGATMGRSISRRWGMTLAVEREIYHLETAHRRGNEIVYERETFATWNGRLELARTFELFGKGATR